MKIKQKIDIKYLGFANEKELEEIHIRFDKKEFYIDLDEFKELIELRRLDFYEDTLDLLFDAGIPFINQKLDKDYIELILPENQPSLKPESTLKRLFLFTENQREYINENDSLFFDFLDRIDEVLEEINFEQGNYTQIDWYLHFKSYIRNDLVSQSFIDDTNVKKMFRKSSFIFKDAERFINHFFKIKTMGILDKIDFQQSDPGIRLYVYLQ